MIAIINYIWGGMIAVSLVVSVFTGKLEEVASAAMNGAADGVTLSISLLGAMCLWTGIMKIAQEAGVIELFAKALRPVTRLLFPNLKQGCKALDAIVMNISANLFGMANAATPLGLNAMRELAKLNKSNVASNEMCMFAVINTASLQFIPSTVIALRQGSQSPFEIIVPVWIASLISVITAIVSAKIFSLRE